MGPEVLIRKLSVDYHIFIPLYFRTYNGDKDMADKIRETIKRLAIRHHISLGVPTQRPVRRTSGKYKLEKESNPISHVFTKAVNSLRAGIALFLARA